MLEITRARFMVRSLVLATLWGFPAADAANPENTDEGQQLYDQNCGTCHQGNPGLGRILTNKEYLSVTSDELIAKTIRDGQLNAGMPPLAHLSKQKRDAIVSYLRSFAPFSGQPITDDARPPAH